MYRSRIWFAGLLVALFAAGPAPAQSESAPTAAEGAAAAAAAAEDTREARASLKKASDYLTALKAYAFDAEYSYDSVQMTGQKLEFGGTRQILVRRPDRVRVERRRRDGEQSTLYFDGKTISIDFPDDQAYVSVEKPGTLDEAVAYIEDALDTPVPFSDLIVSHFYEGLSQRISHGVVVGDEVVNAVPCTHLAFASEGVDFQVWIDTGDKPLIRRIVIDYKGAPRHPQFRAQIMKWNLDPNARDSRFTFRPAKGAERLSVVAATDLRKQKGEDAEGGKP